MRAAQITEFGNVNVIEVVDVDRPKPADGEILIRVKAAGVGPWDAFVRSGMSALPQPLPLILGSDLSGTVEEVDSNVSEFSLGDEVYGVTNEQFTGAYAEYAVVSKKMIATKPKNLNHLEAASAPVVAVTASQALFEHGKATAGQTVLIHGGAGNVGAYAVQFASQAGLHVTATASLNDSKYVKSLGAEKVLDYKNKPFEELVSGFDIVIDTVGGNVTEKSCKVLKPHGILISLTAPIAKGLEERYGVKAIFFLAEVTTARLREITGLFVDGKLITQVGTILPLDDVRKTHEMLAGSPHKRGKIVLSIDA